MHSNLTIVALKNKSLPAGREAFTKAACFITYRFSIFSVCRSLLIHSSSMYMPEGIEERLATV